MDGVILELAERAGWHGGEDAAAQQACECGLVHAVAGDYVPFSGCDVGCCCGTGIITKRALPFVWVRLLP
jgi:hypothetical protein